MVGKQLSALLQILRSQGVTRYQTNAITLELGPAPAKRPPRSIDEVLAEAEGDNDAELDDEGGDMRFGLERLQRKHFPGPKADPRKNTRTQ